MGSDTDGVDSNPFLLGNFGSSERGNDAGIVGAIGEQNNALGFGFSPFDAVDGGGYTVANGCAIGIEHIDVDFIDGVHEHSLMCGHGQKRESFAGENHDANVVGFALRHKVGSHFFCRFQAVGLKVAREHTCRDVDREHNVGAIGFAFRPLVVGLWST